MVRRSSKSARQVELISSVESGLKLVDTLQFPVSKIELDPIFQPRQLINREVVEKYQDMISDEILTVGQTNCPAIDVLLFEEKYFLIHGHHRLQAFVNGGHGEILANIYQGSWQDAIQFSCKANIFNGLQLSRKEVAIACRRYLEINDSLPELERESDRAISRHFMVDPKSIRNYRSQNIGLVAVKNWVNGRTNMVHKSFVNFDPSLRCFCRATYSGNFNPENSTAYFSFENEVCIESGHFSVFDFVEVSDEKLLVDSTLSSPPVGSVVWMDVYYGWGVVYKFDFEQDVPIWFCFAPSRGLCKSYSAFQLTYDQALAVSSDAIELWGIEDISDLIGTIIDRLQAMIDRASEALLNGVEPLLAQSTINRHQREIESLQVEFGLSVAAVEKKSAKKSSAGGGGGGGSGSGGSNSDGEKVEKSAIAKFYDFIDSSEFSLEDLQAFHSELEELIGKWSAYQDVPPDLF